MHKSKYKQKSPKLNKLFLLHAGLLFIILAFFPMRYALRFFEKPARLPVPEIKTFSYSGPLTIDSFDQSVLGTQAIDVYDFINEINMARLRHGSKRLMTHPSLIKAARKRAEVILKYQNFSHLDPYEGIELVTILPSVGYKFKYASENIGMGGLSASGFVEGFLSSPSHKVNLLNPDLTHTGAWITSGAYKQYYVNIAVQLFAIPSGEEEYLGYSRKDIALFEANLKNLKAKTNTLSWNLNNLFSPEKYTRKKKDQIEESIKMIQEILYTMNSRQPLKQNQVAWIMDFNEGIDPVY